MDVHHLPTTLKRSMALIAVVLLGGCDAVNCIIDRSPQFSSESLAVAIVNQEYEATLQADIKNSTEDNQYDYLVTLVGLLPPGMAMRMSGRDVLFTGTPTALGDFAFTLNLSAQPGYPGPGIDLDDQASDLCDEQTSQEFVISVVQGY